MTAGDGEGDGGGNDPHRPIEYHQAGSRAVPSAGRVMILTRNKPLIRLSRVVCTVYGLYAC